MGYAIWTFDLVSKLDDTKRMTRKQMVDLVFFEDCKPDILRKTAQERADYLSVRHHAVFVVRARGVDGTWTDATPDEWLRGRLAVFARVNQARADAKRKRQLKKLGVYYE